MSFQNFCKMESNVIIFHVIIWNGNWYWSSTPTLWPPDAKNWLIWKDPDAGKDWRREEKGMTEDETVGWHHWFNGHEFEKAPGVGDGQGSLVCCSPWSCRVGHDWATELNWKWKHWASLFQFPLWLLHMILCLLFFQVIGNYLIFLGHWQELPVEEDMSQGSF